MKFAGLGQNLTSTADASMSPSYAEAVMREPKTDIAAQRSAIAGRADVDLAGRDFRL
jgi:hypothetical protein